MAMQTIYFKEHEGLVPNTIGQLSSIPSGPWWSAFGTQSVFGDSCGQLKPLSMEQPGTGDQLISTKHAGRGTDLGPDKGNTTQFTIFPGDYKFSGDGQKTQATISLQSSLPEYRARLELGFGQPMVCAKYPYIDQFCGLLSYGHQISGRIMLPLNLTADDGPIYVNAKQYHGIIRRRQSRAKAAVLENKIPKVRKPYMHESRHLHAMRRPRGCGGRFLNTKNLNNDKGGGPEVKKLGNGHQLFRPSRSQSSEVLQSESGTLNSSKEANNSSGSNISGSEVTSMYSRGDLDHFQINPLASSFHSLSDMMENSRGMVMPTKWIAAADHSRCNIKV
ncbi:Nuclear transcription factor Y subunit A [Trema orientale]|uniref:Nuclear transcription factor Y subunit n=1 Tax=Trema orientale TaxID=63057 RepID=A0A2P5AU49_TREOI|nr:Nuclear transcription factor Y subunit A [Trema orientale]